MAIGMIVGVIIAMVSTLIGFYVGYNWKVDKSTDELKQDVTKAFRTDNGLLSYKKYSGVK